MNSQITENYLKALFNLSLEFPEITISQLGEAMEVSIPTAHSMIKKLHQQNLVHYEKYKPIQLTEDGRKTAALIIRKHRLIEMFLVDIMNLGWEEVHDIAEQIEHVNSPRFFNQMDDMLGNPRVDPHGSPIPDKDGNLISFSHRKLTELNENSSAPLVALGQSSQELLHYLNRKGIALGSVLKVLEVEPFDGSMIVQTEDGEKVLFSREVADSLLVDQA